MANYQSSYTGAQIDTCVNTYQNASQVSAAIQSALNTAIAEAKLAMYPIGSIYLSITNTNPGTFIGGTWVQIKDTFLLACGDTYTNASTGGSVSHTHTMEHTHSMEHTHTYSHTHTTPATTTGGHTLTETELPVIDGSMQWHGQEHGTHIYNISGHVTGSKINGMYQTTGQTSGAYSYGSTGFKFGGGGAYTPAGRYNHRFIEYKYNKRRQQFDNKRGIYRNFRRIFQHASISQRLYVEKNSINFQKGGEC